MQNRLSAEAAVAARLIEHGIFRLLLGVGLSLALTLSFNCTCAAAQPITPQSQIVDVMRDPKWIESLRSHLDGDTSPFIEEPLSRSNRFFYVGSLLNNFGKGCGSSISINSAATQSDHILIILPGDTRQPGNVPGLIDQIYRKFPYRISNPKADVEANASSQLTANGISVSDVTMEGGRQGRIVFLDQARLEGPNRDALVDFAIFVGLTGVQVHGAAVDGNRFSYLDGGGDLADMAGDNEGHFGKLCIAVGLIEGVCNGKIAADLTAEQMASQIDHVSDQCGPASALVGQLKYMDSLVRQAGDK